MKQIIEDLKSLKLSLQAQDFPFYMACSYLVFSYLRPQAIYPFLDFLPWTQLSILLGLASAIVRKQFSFSIVNVLMLMFVIIIWISVQLSQYPYISQSKFDIIYIFAIEVLFFVNCVKTLEQFKLVCIVFMLIMFKMSFFGARVWVERGFGFTDWGIAGPTGFFANSGEFSLLMAMVAVLSLGFLIGLGKLNSFYCLLPITAVMTVLGASSRGSQLAIAIGLLYMGFLYRKLNFRYLILIPTIAYVGIQLLPEEQKERFETIGTDGTSQSRLDYWEAGWDMMKEYPVFGVGFYGFPEHYHNNYKIADPEDFLSNRKEAAHNSFVEVGSTLGFVGLSMYLILLFYIYRCASKAFKLHKQHQIVSWLPDFARGLQGCLIIYVIGSSFMSVAFYPYVYLMLMLAFILLEQSRHLVNQKIKGKDNSVT